MQSAQHMAHDVPCAVHFEPKRYPCRQCSSFSGTDSESIGDRCATHRSPIDSLWISFEAHDLKAQASPEGGCLPSLAPLTSFDQPCSPHVCGPSEGGPTHMRAAGSWSKLVKAAAGPRVPLRGTLEVVKSRRSKEMHLKWIDARCVPHRASIHSKAVPEKLEYCLYGYLIEAKCSSHSTSCAM